MIKKDYSRACNLLCKTKVTGKRLTKLTKIDKIHVSVIYQNP